jgi:class 3 adenylate cyclase
VGRAEVITARVTDGLAEFTTIRRGSKVPEAENIGMNEGVELDATYVYADMADSSKLAHSVYKPVAAKIVRAYVNTATYILKAWGGEIRSFDGDRVMAIFIGENMNRSAGLAAMEINWAVQEVIWPRIQKRWNDVATWGWTLGHGVGVDTGEALLIRSGVRGDNDIVSIGKAPNVAAKLSSLRSAGSLYVTQAVYEDFNDNLWYGPKREQMWSRMYSAQVIGGSRYTVWSTNWMRSP